MSFAPTVAGPARATVTVVTGAGTKTTTLTGIGVARAPIATLTGYDYGNIFVGDKTHYLFTFLTNTGTAPLTLGAVSVSGAEFSSTFIASGLGCPSTLAVGQRCGVAAVSFAPTVAGPATATVTVVTGAGTKTATLTGTGIAVSPVGPEIDFGKGFTADALTSSGAAGVVSGTLQLTSGPSSAASSAFYPTPVPATGFNTNFTFQLLDPTAEGITFTIQGEAPNAVGSSGGGLGYQGIPKSIAIKFDLKNTAGEGTDSTGVYINGAAPTVPATSLAASGIDLHGGHIFNLALTYDGTTMTINLLDTVTHAIWATQVAENIPAIVGSDFAYFGFTAGSGTPALGAKVAVSQHLGERTAVTSSAVAPATASKILTWTYVAGQKLGTKCTVIDYSKGLTAAGFALNGSAKVVEHLLQLTDGGHSEAGSAFFSTPLPTTSFVTDVTFQIVNPEADGIAVVIQGDGPRALGEGGGGLGYAGIAKSVALKFDLHNNAGEGTNSTGVYINGAYPSQPSISLDGSKVDLHSGHIFRLHIVYAGKGAAVTLTDTTTGVVIHDLFPGNIMEGIGISAAYFGFTGGTGSETATQNILSWTYSGGSGCPLEP